MSTVTARIARELSNLLRGRNALIAITTHEDDHAARIVREAAIDRGLAVVGWTAVRGLHEALTVDGDAMMATEHPAGALQRLSLGWGVPEGDGAVALMLDLAPHLSDPRTARALRDHLRKRGRDPKALGIDLDRLAAATEGYSPAEIEHAINSALHDAFETGAALTTQMIERAAMRSPPLSATARERIDALREWADGRCVWADVAP